MTYGQPAADVPASQVPEGGWLLDVREMYEWRAGHVPGARHIPMSELNQRSDEIPADQMVYVICRSGARSAVVAQALNGSGWQAVNVAGGMLDWAAAGRPMVSDVEFPPVVA